MTFGSDLNRYQKRRKRPISFNSVWRAAGICKTRSNDCGVDVYAPQKRLLKRGCEALFQRDVRHFQLLSLFNFRYPFCASCGHVFGWCAKIWQNWSWKLVDGKGQGNGPKGIKKRIRFHRSSVRTLRSPQGDDLNKSLFELVVLS